MAAPIIFAASVVAMILAFVLLAVATDEPVTADAVLFPVAYLAFGAVGALVLVRQPANVIGRLALLTGALGAIAGLADTLARVVPPLPAQEWAAWLTTWLFPMSLLPPLLLLLLFPTGRLASPRWRLVAAMIVAGGLVVVLANAFTPRLSDHPAIANPLRVAWLTGSPFESGGVGWFPLLVGAVLAGAGLGPRLRRARGIERAQLKWIAYAAALQGVAWIVLALDLPGVAGELAQDALFLTLALIPVAAGIAILRYRLYDIDVVIRRTLVYGAVVGVLGVLYLGLVLSLQSGLTGITGGETLPVALSTLITAALFAPVRTHARSIVDRRFYRSAYDAQRMAERFASDLRDVADLATLDRAVRRVAVDAVQPTTAELWVRDRRDR